MAWRGACDHPRCRGVTRLPFPTRDYRLRGLAVPALSLSLRDVEELLAERGVAVTYETIGQWVRRFGPVFAQELRRRGRRPGDKLHLDEVALKINGRRHWLWRAVDQHGFVVDILVQSRRDQHAAEAFIRRAVAGGRSCAGSRSSGQLCRRRSAGTGSQ